MKHYYVSVDLKSGRIFVSSYENTAKSFLIECESRSKADNLVRDLNSHKILDPIDDISIYFEIEKIEEALGTVTVYQLKKFPINKK